VSRPGKAGHSRARRRRRLVGLSRLALLFVAIAAGIIIATSLRPGVAPGKALAERFALAWSRRDWSALYEDVDAATLATVPYAQFARDYSRAEATATVTSARALRGIHSVGGSEVVPLAIHTRLFGTLRQRYTLPLTGSGSATRVVWNANLAFPGLYPGETLHRVVSTPQRGQLLARDGVPLTSYSSTANLIGSVGLASGSQLAQLEAEGFPATTDVGLDGLEYLFERQLAGRPGGELFAGPRLIARTRPVPGADVRTSIDPELENDATAALSGTGTDGGIVMMVPRTGELLAAAGSPLSQTQPPGSTFKIVTATGVLEAGLAKISSTFPYATYALIDGYKLHNSNGEDCGGTLINAFAVSCNSVYAPLGVELGAQRLVATADLYGFDAPSPIATAQASFIPPASEITDPVELGSSAIGQYEDLASPLQMLRIAATVALGGLEPVPTFQLVHHPKFPRVIPAWVARTLRKMMIAVVRYSDGTGVEAQLPNVLVAGKTGTAQLTVPTCPSGPTGLSGVTGLGTDATPSGATGPCANIPNNPYNTDAWFVAFAPAYHPKIAVAVLLDHDGAGGTSAAPLARDLIAAALELGY
jgi:cell division protein FtsI/penicillin-binding protein 2